MEDEKSGPHFLIDERLRPPPPTHGDGYEQEHVHVFSCTIMYTDMYVNGHVHEDENKY
jgi:hypothetical protein